VRFTPQDEEFRAAVRAWLEASLTGEFAALRGAGGPGREHERHQDRLAWNRHLAAAGWTALGWPAEFGGRGLSLARQVIFHEEYARAGAQKIWTSLAHVADWCFVLARTEPGSARGQGLSYLLVPMHQPGVTVRPIRQLTGTSEFNEVFFDGARTAAAHVVGRPGDGWQVAKATLTFERGAAMLGLQVGFRRDLENLLNAARRNGTAADPLTRDKLARAWIGLEAVRAYALDTLGG
jgi:alkylation response protein AidB-like acyl-CoA dehydrogenase